MPCILLKTYRLVQSSGIPGRVRLVDKLQTLVVEKFLRFLHGLLENGAFVRSFVRSWWYGSFVSMVVRGETLLSFLLFKMQMYIVADETDEIMIRFVMFAQKRKSEGEISFSSKDGFVFVSYSFFHIPDFDGYFVIQLGSLARSWSFCYLNYPFRTHLLLGGGPRRQTVKWTYLCSLGVSASSATKHLNQKKSHLKFDSRSQGYEQLLVKIFQRF